MDTTELRPLALGELLDRTFRLYRSHFWLFTGIMVIPSAFSIPFTTYFFSTQTSAITGAVPTPKFAIVLGLFVFTFFCLFWAVYSLAIGATTYAVSEAYLGQKVTVRGAYGKVRGNFWRILGTFIVAWIRVVGMGILVITGIAVVSAISIGLIRAVGVGQSRMIAGIVFGLVIGLSYLAGIGLWLLWALRYAVSIPALLLEHLGVLAALRRSVHLTKGRRWQLLVAIFLCSIIANVGAILFQGPFFIAMMISGQPGRLPDWLAYAFAVSGAVGSAITGPILLIALVLCYYDTRIRKEAFDLQFMMSALDQTAPASGAGSPA